MVALAEKYNQRLFSSNIRQFLGKSGLVNQEISNTAIDNPELFWYFNNGVTAIADQVRKTVTGGSKREVGDISCKGLSIVNGAQTIGTLTQLHPNAKENLSSVMVPIRIISLESGGSDLGLEITRATNTQNRVDSRNFVALSELHQRIRRDLLMDGVTYIIQQTDADDRGPKLFGVSEAFPAMACSLPSVDAAVTAKREISRLWENLDSPLHKEMFPEGIDAALVWKNVKVLRTVERAVERARQTAPISREKTVLAHGNRLTAHITFRLIEKYGKTDADLFDLAARIAFFLSAVVADVYVNQYPAVIFKNTDMCKDIVASIIGYVDDTYLDPDYPIEREFTL